jgi:hypothetical protein
LAKSEVSEKEKLDLLLSMSTRERQYAMLIVLISNFVPEDLWITHLILNETAVQIYGATFNNQLVSQFIGTLDESKVFRNSHLDSSEKQVIESHAFYNFQITTEPVWGSPQLLEMKDLKKAHTSPMGTPFMEQGLKKKI